MSTYVYMAIVYSLFSQIFKILIIHSSNNFILKFLLLLIGPAREMFSLPGSRRLTLDFKPSLLCALLEHANIFPLILDAH